MNCPLCHDTGKIKVDDYKTLTRHVKECPVCAGITIDKQSIIDKLLKEVMTWKYSLSDWLRI